MHCFNTTIARGGQRSNPASTPEYNEIEGKLLLLLRDNPQVLCKIIFPAASKFLGDATRL